MGQQGRYGKCIHVKSMCGQYNGRYAGHCAAHLWIVNTSVLPPAPFSPESSVTPRRYGIIGVKGITG